MKQARIVVAVPIFPNIVQTYILNQLAAFKSKGINFSVLAIVKRAYDPLPKTVDKYKLLDDAFYINASFRNIVNEIFSLPLLSTSYWHLVKKIFSNKNLRHDYGWTYRLKSLLRARALIIKPFDIMHSHSLSVSYHYLFIIDLFSIPIITTYHGQVPKGVKKLDDDKLAKVLQRGKAFIVNTTFAQDELVGLGCDPGKIKIIPQGIILDNFPFKQRSIDPQEKIILLTVGRLSIEKGHHIALVALKNLCQQYPTLEYHIVGHGPISDELRKLTEQYKLSDHVIFHGFRTGAELRSIFDLAHIFVLPSINTGDGYLVETQGVVLQEAQASGIPVIGSRTGGIPDVIIDDETGMLFEENNDCELTDKIERLISDAALYNRLGRSGRKDVEDRFDIDVVSNRLIAAYHDTLN